MGTNHIDGNIMLKVQEAVTFKNGARRGGELGWKSPTKTVMLSAEYAEFSTSSR